MLKTKPNALKVVETTLGKITGVKKPVTKFVIHIVELWLGMNCRYVFSNMERWGSMTEKSYRNGFKKFFDWLGFNFELVKQHSGKEIIAVFAPSYIKKSGLHLITKARSDANLMYLFKGKQKGGKGRKKMYDGKINIQKIDKRRLPCCYSDDKMKVYAGQVYCILLKQIALAAFIYYGDKQKPEIIIGTDTEMEAIQLCHY